MLIPLKHPKIIDTIIIIPEMMKIEVKSAIKRKCDHPRVVGENESCKVKIKSFYFLIIINVKRIWIN